MKKLAVLVCILGLLSGCSGTVDAEGLSKIGMDNSKDESLNVTENIEETLNVFKGTEADRAFKMLSILSNGKDNIMISPKSIDFALAMAMNAGNDILVKAFEDYFGHTKNVVNDTLSKYIATIDGETLQIVNSCWIDEKYFEHIEEDFKLILEEEYKAQIGSVSDSPEVINNWVSEHTNGMIREIVGELSPEFAAMLVNAIYFNGTWSIPFNTGNTKLDKFTLTDGSIVECNMMESKEGIYLENAQATAFRKNYQNGYSFIGILPKEGIDFDISEFNYDVLKEMETYEYDVYIKMPKFESEYSTSLNNTLIKLGLGSIFEEGYISGLIDDSITDVKVTDVIHKTAIKVDEEGTEASAVTGIEMETCGIELEKKVKEVYLNRPFYYMIVDDINDAILFVGEMLNPTL